MIWGWRNGRKLIVRGVGREVAGECPFRLVDFIPIMPGVLSRTELILDDSQMLAVQKSAGLAAIPGRGEDDSVLEQLARLLGLPCSGQVDPRIRVVHRLDKDTSGVMLFAKTVEAQRFLSHQFQNNTIAKEYLALVAGHPTEPSGEIDAPLDTHPANPLRMAVLKHGRPALTLWQLEEKLGPFALLRAFPKTGKTHQIRVHLAHIGLPLAIDPLYNHRNTEGNIRLSQIKAGYRAKAGQDEPALISRLTLHAHRVTFVHPANPTGEPVTLEAELPKDFERTLKQLRKWAKPWRQV
jgi:23S rRNA pseudouridine1911/1915/1917 synthase